ncbi:MAG: cytochrome c oxidase assembly protein [Pseudomonadota bacterium]
MNKDVRKTVAVCVIVSFVVFSFCFSMVPLYNAICRTTGLNGRVNLKPVKKTPQNPVNSHRGITMQFVTTTNSNLAWDFYPQNSSMVIHPEENNKMLFYVKNNSNKTVTVQAIPSITPWQAAKHLHKIQCFCFTQQTLAAGASMAMPVVFRIDNDVPDDIATVTLSYTLFDINAPKNGRVSA